MPVAMPVSEADQREVASINAGLFLHLPHHRIRNMLTWVERAAGEFQVGAAVMPLLYDQKIAIGVKNNPSGSYVVRGKRRDVRTFTERQGELKPLLCGVMVDKPGGYRYRDKRRRSDRNLQPDHMKPIRAPLLNARRKGFSKRVGILGEFIRTNMDAVERV